MIDRERFTQARRSCPEPDRSVGKEPVGEPSLSSEEECLSLHSPMLPQEEKSGNGNPTTQSPNKDSPGTSGERDPGVSNSDVSR